VPEDARADTAKIAELRGVIWEWREDAPADAKDQPGMGVIAQDVEKVFQELVSTDEQGRKRVAYHGLVAPLIEAVKELDARVSRLESALAAGTAETARPPGRDGSLAAGRRLWPPPAR
jgi:endosialidase-like protein